MALFGQPRRRPRCGASSIPGSTPSICPVSAPPGRTPRPARGLPVPPRRLAMGHRHQLCMATTPSRLPLTAQPTVQPPRGTTTGPGTPARRATPAGLSYPSGTISPTSRPAPTTPGPNPAARKIEANPRLTPGFQVLNRSENRSERSGRTCSPTSKSEGTKAATISPPSTRVLPPWPGRSSHQRCRSRELFAHKHRGHRRYSVQTNADWGHILCMESEQNIKQPFRALTT
jgi:hypothetical protein